MGSHLKNTICLAGERKAVFSAHVGDLETADSRAALRDAISATVRLTGVEPNAIAYDLHPEYASTRVAESIARELGITTRVPVQHHHAHIAACVAEHGVIDPVIGVAFDGTGLGTDGAIWGGEFLVAHGAEFARVGHLGYVPLPAGDATIRRPWHSAAAHLVSAGVRAAAPKGVYDEEWSAMARLLERPSRMTQTSSVGRLFDAVASLLDVCHVARFDGEAPMSLEAIADSRARRRYPVTIAGEGPWNLDPGDIIRGIVEDRRNGLGTREIAGAFHLTLSDAIVAGCERIRESTGLVTVALGGGAFMNGLLLASACEALVARGFRVLAPLEVPCNDGGLALGQAYVAAHALAEDVCA
jgi:hydrogenase maturation protein HypF